MQKLNDINFTLGQGGSGRQAPGSDYISGLMFFNSTRPAALLASLPGGVDNFSTGSVVQVNSTSDAEALGIVDTYTDETKPTSTVLVTAVGSDGDTISLNVAEWMSGVAGRGNILLGTYTKVAGDTTTGNVATGIANAINANTNTHGYVATVGSSTVTITARPGIGTYFNTGTPYTTTIVGTIAVTLTQNVVAGVASKLAVYHYHIDRYFRQKPDGTLFIGMFNVGGATGASAFSDIANMMSFSDDSIVQIGIWDDTQTFALATLTKIQTAITAVRVTNSYLSNVTYAADIKAISGALTTALPGVSYNLATLTANNVSALIDNDGNGTGFDLFKQVGKTISSLGACIGCISEAAISEDYGNCIPRFNTDDGTEFDTLMFGDGTPYKQVQKNTLDALNNNRYVYLSKIKNNTANSWYSDDHCAVAYTNDYAWVHDNRVIDRVIKNSFVALTPVLKSKLLLNTDGTMTASTIQYITSVEGDVIKPLIASGDLAGDPNNFNASNWVLISATQKPNVAGKLIIGVKLAENGIAHSISIPIGFGTF